MKIQCYFVEISLFSTVYNAEKVTGHKFDKTRELIMFRVKWEDYPE